MIRGGGGGSIAGGGSDGGGSDGGGNEGGGSLIVLGPLVDVELELEAELEIELGMVLSPLTGLGKLLGIWNLKSVSLLFLLLLLLSNTAASEGSADEKSLEDSFFLA